jgi:hypothetical protein
MKDNDKRTEAFRKMLAACVEYPAFLDAEKETGWETEIDNEREL